MAARENITQYLDYRTFLVAHAQDQRRRYPSWTYGSWAKRLGLSGTASLTRILQGDREPGPKMVVEMVRYFSFSEKEAEYFRDLVRLTKLKRDPKLSSMLMEKMGKKFVNGRVRMIDDKTFNTISNWYYLAVREMVRLNHFSSDPAWIAKNLTFKVTPREVGQAIKTLIDVGLLSQTEEGQLQIAEGRLDTRDDVASEAIKRYHEEMLDNAKQALRCVQVEKRDITAQSIVISSENLSRAKELIRQFQDKFSELIEQESGDAVYQLQIQFFPLTKEVKGL